MTECTVCQGRSNNGFLCARCCTELRTLLDGLAIGNPLGNGRRSRPWLVCLEDTRFGHTRLGESERQGGERNTPLVVRLGPKSNPDREEQWENSPIEVLRSFHGCMSTWIRHLTEARGATFVPVRSVPVWFVGPLREGWRRLPQNYTASITDCAEWLAYHVGAIANDEAAAELFHDVKTAVDAITSIINRPLPPRRLGPCKALLTDNYGERVCNTQLTAERNVPDDGEVQCGECGTTWIVKDVYQSRLDEAEDMSFTLKDLYRTVLPVSDLYVSMRTLQHWAASGRLVPTGYEGDEPRFLFADVRELREAKAQKAPTGAAAEKYKRKAC